MEIEVSVIIPCLNEITTISNCISAVSDELVKTGFNFEVIVVDNGSADGSDHAAISHGAILLYNDSKTIAGVRNAGVSMARGQVIVFLDADIIVQSLWGQTLRHVYKRMMEDDNFITGSHPQVPDNIRPTLYSWYKGIADDTRDTHLGTGHMVVSKDTFEKIGGFGHSLASGEDFDFCYRAKKLGISVHSNPRMKVFHLGYPNNYIDFAKREIWHGLGDCSNWKSFLRSRLALCGTIFVLLNFLFIISLIGYVSFIVPIIILIIIITLGVNYYKFGYGNILDFIYRVPIAYIYLFSRGLSLPTFIFKKFRGVNR